ncbi:uncharacterized protein [Epargyreus clarus]
MGVPYITSFFWCMSLETGTKLISILHLAWSLAVTATLAFMASEAHGFVGTVEDIGDHVYTTVYTALVVIAVFSGVHIVLAFTLFYGAFRRKTLALRVWVCVMLALLAAALLLAAAACAVSGFRASGSDIFLYFLEGLLLFGFLAYCILCVNSYYLLLKSAEDMEGPTKVDY